MDYREKLVNYPRLKPDDSFTFGCNRCGRCCRNREDVMLTPLDIYKIAKHLRVSTEDVINNYCECYIGDNSKLPIVRIRPREYRKTCPFNDKGRCAIHSSKPVACAMFPLARVCDGKDVFYVLQKVECGNKKQSQTVRQWLGEFEHLLDEEFPAMHQKFLRELSTFLHELKEAGQEREKVLNLIGFNLYVLYDIDKDFMPQFKANCAFISDFMETHKKKGAEE